MRLRFCVDAYPLLQQKGGTPVQSFLNSNHKLIRFLNAVFDLLLLSLFWLLLCLPVVTVPAASAALYHAVMKTVRKDCGNAVSEFWSSFRSNLSSGIRLQLLILLLGGLLLLGCLFLVQNVSNESGSVLLFVCLFLLAFLLAGGTWTTLYLSRFQAKLTDYLCAGVFLTVRYIHVTLLLLGLGVVFALGLYLVPPLVCILPGVFALAGSFAAEPVLIRYMPDDDGSGYWYWSNKQKERYNNDIHHSESGTTGAG